MVDLAITFGISIIYGYFPNGANSCEGGCSGHCQKGGLMALIIHITTDGHYYLGSVIGSEALI